MASTAAEQKTCSKCGVTKGVGEFYKRTGGGFSSMCRSCAKAYQAAKGNTVRGFTQKLIQHANEHTDTRNAKRRRDARQIHALSNIDADYLLSLQPSVNGVPVSFLSGYPLEFKRFTLDQASLERFLNDVGYIRGNVGLLEVRFNTQNQWTAEKYDNMFLDWEQFHAQRAAEMANVPENPHLGMPQRANEETKKAYDTVYNQQSKSGLMSVMAANSNKRNKEKGAAGLPRITASDMAAKWEGQCGLCAYSDTPMDWRRGDWRASIERADPKKPYTLDNILLVCQEMNCIDNAVRNPDTTAPKLGWSRAMVQRERERAAAKGHRSTWTF